MSILIENNLLKAAEKKIEDQLTGPNRANYLKIVTAGMALALDKGPDGILGQLRNSEDPVRDSAIGAINLCLTMRQQSRGTMPMKAMVPAAMTLMLMALDFADKAGIAKVGRDELVQASHVFTNHLFEIMGVTPDMLRGAAEKVNAITQDPQKMAAINQKAELKGLPAGGADGV
jgi:hypothetical protein